MANDTKPRQIKDGFIIGCCLILAGALIQFTAGPVNWRFFTWPVNLITVSFLFLLSVIIFALRDKVRPFYYLGTLHAAVPVMILAVALTIVMGLTRQVAPGEPSPDPLGLHYMLTSWPFVLIYSLLVIILIQAVLVEITHPSLRKIPAFCFHLGFVLVLVAGTLGSPDVTSVSMVLDKEHTQHKGIDEFDNEIDMPIALQLVSFDIEYFEPEEAGASPMMRRMPKKFLGKVHYWTEEDKAGMAEIEVNKPYKLGKYKIYLEDYDMEDDGSVQTCSVGVVADPWQPAVYAGAFLMLFGALLLIFMPRKRKEDSK